MSGGFLEGFGKVFGRILEIVLNVFGKCPEIAWKANNMYASMKVNKYSSVQMCKYASIQLHNYASIQVCTYTTVQVCKSVSLQLCKYATISLNQIFST